MLVYLIILCFFTTEIECTFMKQKAAYGSWRSAISAHIAAASETTFHEITAVGDALYWLEPRPQEKGRVALMQWRADTGEKEMLPAEYSVKSRVHEMGGGALLVGTDCIYFVRNQDQQIYRLHHDGSIKQITFREKARFSDGCIHPITGTLYYVMEDHADLHNNEPRASIVSIDIDGILRPYITGNDFYASPRISPDGTSLAYVTWNHPNMPWDNTQLYVHNIKTDAHQLVAGTGNESIVNPQWAPDGTLYYVSDRTNWWNIYTEHSELPIWQVDGECALPHWFFNRSQMAFIENDIFCSYVHNAIANFAYIQRNGSVERIDLPYTSVRGVSASGNQVAFIAGSPNQPYSIITYDVITKEHAIIKQSSNLNLDIAYVSIPSAIEFPTTNGRTAHAFYYPPSNPHYDGPNDEKPPLLVRGHGGPTGNTVPIYSTDILYWTSRGFAVVDVNYGGSTGYGREYRERLKLQWGIVDVDDCTNAALYCVQEGLVDADRLCIEGESAGGFTTLAALAFKNVFKVGANYYGVSELERLTLDTHKFESHYLDQLVGPYPQELATYRARSPIYSIDTISSPVIIFQGGKDTIVPPSQSEMMYETLKNKGIPTTYVFFEDEGHGFGKVENGARALEAQLYFFAKVLDIPITVDIYKRAG